MNIIVKDGPQVIDHQLPAIVMTTIDVCEDILYLPNVELVFQVKKVESKRAGYYSNEDHKAVIFPLRTNRVLTDLQISWVVAHELGHADDYQSGSVSEFKEDREVAADYASSAVFEELLKMGYINDSQYDEVLDWRAG